MAKPPIPEPADDPDPRLSKLDAKGLLRKIKREKGPRPEQPDAPVPTFRLSIHADIGTGGDYMSRIVMLTIDEVLDMLERREQAAAAAAGAAAAGKP